MGFFALGLAFDLRFGAAAFFAGAAFLLAAAVSAAGLRGREAVVRPVWALGRDAAARVAKRRRRMGWERAAEGSVKGLELSFVVEARAQDRAIGSTRCVNAHEELGRCLNALRANFEASIVRRGSPESLIIDCYSFQC